MEKSLTTRFSVETNTLHRRPSKCSLLTIRFKEMRAKIIMKSLWNTRNYIFM